VIRRKKGKEGEGKVSNLKEGNFAELVQLQRIRTNRKVITMRDKEIVKGMLRLE